MKRYVDRNQVEFPVMRKCLVNGENALYSYKFLKRKCDLGDDGISWNFQKFLIDKHGKVIKHYDPMYDTIELFGEIEKLVRKR